MRAMTMVVHRGGGPRHETHPANIVWVEVRVIEVDPRIYDRYAYAFPLGIGPGLRRVNLLYAGRNGLSQRGRLVFNSQVGERASEGVTRRVVLDHGYVLVIPDGVDFSVSEMRVDDGHLVLIYVVAK